MILKNNDLKQKIQKELDVVYVDSGGTRHLDFMKALCAEAQIQTCKDRNYK